MFIKVRFRIYVVNIIANIFVSIFIFVGVGISVGFFTHVVGIVSITSMG